MKARKESVILELTKSLQLLVEGIFVPREEQTLYPVDNAYPGSNSEFAIENIEIHHGTVNELMNWNDEWLYSQINDIIKNLQSGKPRYAETLYEYLEELCIKQIENE